MRIELRSELAVERDAHCDAISIHHLDVAIEQLRIVLSFDVEVRMNIDHCPGGSFDYGFRDTDTSCPFGRTALRNEP
jgi:hypothetical protein